MSEREREREREREIVLSGGNKSGKVGAIVSKQHQNRGQAGEWMPRLKTDPGQSSTNAAYSLIKVHQCCT